MKFRTQYNRSGLEPIPSYNPIDNVKRQYTELCDINNIINEFSGSKQLPFKKDFSYGSAGVNMTDFQNAYSIVNSVSDEFQSLPSDIRSKFGNNVFDYVQALTDAYSGDKAALDKFISLGLSSPLNPVPGDPSNLTEPQLSESGGNVSVHTPPDDSKNSDGGL